MGGGGRASEHYARFALYYVRNISNLLPTGLHAIMPDMAHRGR